MKSTQKEVAQSVFTIGHRTQKRKQSTQIGSKCHEQIATISNL